MGLVETSWDGTNIEAWSSPDSLHACKLSDDEDQKYELCSDVFCLNYYFTGQPVYLHDLLVL